MTLTIRPATVEDAEGIARVNFLSSFDAYAELLGVDWFAQHPMDAEAVDNWRAGIQRGRSATTVAAAPDGVVGFAVTGPPRDDDAPRDLELALLYLLTPFHGGGAAQALLDASVGERPAYLWTFNANARAQAFYRRNGFTPDGAVRRRELFRDVEELRMVRG